MLNTFEIIRFSLRLIGFKYSVLIFFSISLTLGLLLFSQSVLKGYEKSLLIKIIGSTPHVSMLLKKQIDDSEINKIKDTVNKLTSIPFSAKGLAYSGTADIFTVGIKETKETNNSLDNISESWEQEELKSQSPEIFFKGIVYSKEYAEYLEKILIGFDHKEGRNKSIVNEIYTYKDPKDWDEALIYRKPIAFPPSLYREIIDPYIAQANYPFIRFKEANKNFGRNNRLDNKKIEFVVVSGLDTPVSDDTVPIISAYETIKYILKGTTQTPDTYNYVEFFLENPMEATSISNKLKEIYDSGVQISSWSDKYKSEMALINIFNVLLLSVMIGTGISIGLLLSSLLDITVRRKRRQISILLSIGSEKQLITKIFIYYSLFLGAIGYIASLFMANILDFLLLTFSNMEASFFKGSLYIQLLHEKMQNIPDPDGISLYNAGIIFFAILIISFLSSYHSAVEASKTNPIEGLKEG